MKIEQTGMNPGSVESIQGVHLRRLKPETKTRQAPEQENLPTRSESDRIHEEKSRLNAFSMEVRATDKALEAAETLLDRLRAKMLGVVKQYPPYPPGSEDRVERLKGISALRKEIDQLTVPPVEQKIPKPNTATEDQESPVKTMETMTAEIPELSPTSTDEEIVQAAGAVRDSIDTIRNRRRELQKNADAALRHEARKSLWQKFFKDIPALNSASSADGAARIAASSLPDPLGKNGVRSLTLNSAPLTDFLS